MFTRSAPAKLNLGLHVLRRQPDGYHDLDTVFLPIGWHDVLQADLSAELTLTCSDARLPVDGGNLVVRAAEMLRQESRMAEGAALHLEKHLPFGAGLGGGSSDAATALLLLCELWKISVQPARLHAMARVLGADVPFFLDPQPMRGTGRGDVLTPLRTAEGEEFSVPFPIVVAVPTLHVSTADAYRLVQPSDRNRPDLTSIVRSLDLERWRDQLINDFEAPVVTAHPVLGALRAALQDAGAAYVSMSGSGSAFYGLFEENRTALAAAEALRYAGHRVWHGAAL